QIFDPATLAWSATGSMTNARALGKEILNLLPSVGNEGAASLLPDGRVLVVGGGASSAALPGEIYDPVSGTWSLTGTMASPTASNALLLPNGKVLISYITPATSSPQVSPATFNAELFDPVSGRR